MTRETLTDAITELDSDILDRYFTMKNALTENKKPKKYAWLKWASLSAACLFLVFYVIPIMKVAFTGAQSEDPNHKTFASIEEMHDALGYDTLYANLDLDGSIDSDFSISYTFVRYDDDQYDNRVPTQLDSNLPPKKPSQLLIRASYPNGDLIDYVDYYIIFDKDSVDDSYIGGYEEQGLTKEIDGITVHYSLIQDGAMHGQAKFIYEENLYVIDVCSWGDEYHLDTYVDMVLNGEKG